MEYRLEIKPSIPPAHRHKIEDVLQEMGYHISGGGTDIDLTTCDISFYDFESKVTIE